MDASTNSSATDTAQEALFPGEDAPPPLLTPPAAAEPPPIPVRPRAAPVDEADRYDTLDVIRGVALCGILLVNMEAFAMVREARYDPTISGDGSPLDKLVWLVTFLFADTKFIAIFTTLFGAGIAMAHQRRKERAQRGTWAVHYRRMIFMLAVGAAHGLFLWRGDILYFYAFWGLVLYPAPRLPSIALVLIGLGLYGWYLDGFAQQLLSASEGYSLWELQIYRGPWQLQYEYRLESQSKYLFELPLLFGNHLVGLMCIGMALFKIGWLAGRWSTWGYAIFAAATLASGTWLVVDSTQLGSTFVDVNAAKEFVWGSLLLSFGYMAFAISLTKAIGLRFGLGGLAALGRMAFTNYLMQSVICTTIFYGYGLGQFERLTRTEQAGIVLGIWIFQIIFSLVWLRIFRIGPLEWVWRSFSYLKLQPFLRRREIPAEMPIEGPASVL
jgi:uncharacterized protein